MIVFLLVLEIQEDIIKISEFKVEQAYKIYKKPVITEDTGLFLESMGGLPGQYMWDK